MCFGRGFEIELYIAGSEVAGSLIIQFLVRKFGRFSHLRGPKQRRIQGRFMKEAGTICRSGAWGEPRWDVTFRESPAETQHQRSSSTLLNRPQLLGLIAGLSASICLQNATVALPERFARDASRILTPPFRTGAVSEGGYSRGGRLRRPEGQVRPFFLLGVHYDPD